MAPATLDDVQPVSGPTQLLAVRAEVDAVTVSDAVIAYVAAVVRRSRELPSVVLGASPRAGVHLLAVAKAWACLNGRTYVVPDDVASLVTPVLHHRLILVARGRARPLHRPNRLSSRCCRPCPSPADGGDQRPSDGAGHGRDEPAGR